MALTINTNISSLIAQRNLNSATNSLNTAIERMTTGYKINHASDDAAGYSIANLWETQLGSLDVAADNAATGSDLLTTAEETYSLLTSHLQRVRDLTEQAANGTYGSASLKAIQSEISARLQEVNRIAANAEFNGIKLMAFNLDGTGNETVGITNSGIQLQVGLYADENSIIKLDVELFSNASLSGLFANMTGETPTGLTLSDLITNAGGDISALGDAENIEAFAAACSGLVYNPDDGSFIMQVDGDSGAKEMLSFIDTAIEEISSTLKDADIAEESSNYIQAQILQQASATLLATANQLPSIALNLI